MFGYLSIVYISKVAMIYSRNELMTMMMMVIKKRTFHACDFHVICCQNSMHSTEGGCAISLQKKATFIKAISWELHVVSTTLKASLKHKG